MTIRIKSQAMEKAAQKLSEIMDHPWGIMPEQGRKKMRKNIQSIVDVAEVLEEPDCRTCLNFHDEFEVFTGCGIASFKVIESGPCVGGDKYKPDQGIRFYTRLK